MIISHRKKFAFFANQKTGSKAVGLMLRLSGIFDENDIMMAQPFPATRSADINLPAYNLGKYSTYEVNHMTPAQAIAAEFITMEQLREYDCYAFLRDPEERFKAVRAAMQTDRNGMAATPNRRAGSLAPPQHDFFYVDGEQVVTPLNFDNLEKETRMLISKLGGYEQIDVAQITVLYKVDMPITPVKFDRRHHMEDILLYREMIGNED
jgi:hypothetical protein